MKETINNQDTKVNKTFQSKNKRGKDGIKRDPQSQEILEMKETLEIYLNFKQNQSKSRRTINSKNVNFKKQRVE